MTGLRVTLVVVPRERFSYARRSLESIQAHTRYPHATVYVDGCSPPPVRRYLEEAAGAHGIRLLRTDYPLTPNEARNLGWREVDTEYVVFIDNDVLVRPGWLERLVAAADDSGAWVAGPLYLIGPPDTEIIHMAGGEASIRTENGVRRFHEEHHLGNVPLAEARDWLSTGPTQMVEFHCMLVRREVFDRLGPLDEGLLSHSEHVDLCLQVREAGGSVILAADSIVHHVPPPPFAPMDLPYYLMRWSEDWNRRSLDHFIARWNLVPEDPHYPRLLSWLTHHREGALESLSWPAGKALRRLRRGPLRGVAQRVISSLEAARVSKLKALRAQSRTASPVTAEARL